MTMGGLQNLAELAGKLQAPQTVVAAIKYASDRTGVDFGFLLDKAKTESSFDPNAKAKTSSATGLYQFIEKTWLQMVRDHGANYGLDKYACAIDQNCRVTDPALKAEILNLRKDPTIATYMAAEFTKANEAQLDSQIKGEVGKTELYLAHFMGAGAAGKFLKTFEKNPHAIAADFMPTEAAANKNIFYDRSGRARSVGEIYNNFAKKFDDKAVSFTTPPTAQPLPQSPALAAVALALPVQANDLAMDQPIPNFNIAAIANIPLQQKNDVASQALAAFDSSPIRQQTLQQQLSFLTQVAMEAMHSVASPGLMLDEKADSRR
ncbi:MAG TPA: transglycosylase SLT domain-containing protein, partial [Alphaproteobacteria bacterium]|nr:transglycosylase SLT domain-containing protein [Alphaproteobacteria bacterium]